MIFMFDDFLRFIKKDILIDNKEEFLEKMSEIHILNEMYRIFDLKGIEKWKTIVEDTFPGYKGRITLFGYDWLGRIFATNNTTGTVLMFEPGTGEVLDIPASLEDFHNIEIVEYNDDCLASGFFNEWYSDSNYKLKKTECVGYKVPLFLGGKDVIDNLEISDMEVYWEIMMPLI